MGIVTDPEKVHEVLTRGVSEVIHYETLKEKLLSGKQLRVKLGIDPTSPNIHLGRTVPLLKLRDFQELGHQIVFIVGDFTGVIGDTSDKESERPMLTEAEIEENKKSYFAQVGKILDISAVELHYNSEWLGSLTYREIGEHADQFSVADFIARENIQRRLAAGKRVSLREVLYPLMQGYDSVAVRADVEVGGSDQKFNILAGRTLQGHFGQEAQNIILNPLVNGLDGRKMSSSWGNTITITLPPEDMYGKIMTLADEEIITYFIMFTRLPLREIEGMKRELEGGANPRDIKMWLARTLVDMYHQIPTGVTPPTQPQTPTPTQIETPIPTTITAPDLLATQAPTSAPSPGEAAEKAFVEVFQKKEAPEIVPEIRKPYVENLIAADVVVTKNELRRLLEGGGVRNAETDEKLDRLPETVSVPTVLKLGKRRFVKLLP